MRRLMTNCIRIIGKREIKKGITMAQEDIAKQKWTQDNYCRKEALRIEDEGDWSSLPRASREFLASLELPRTNPFCEDDRDKFYVDNIPPMGPMVKDDYHTNGIDALITTGYQTLPALFAMIELWFKLFAIFIAPTGIFCMLVREINDHGRHRDNHSSTAATSNGTTTANGSAAANGCTTAATTKDERTTTTTISNTFCVGMVCTVVSSIVTMTDNLYILEFGGPHLGCAMFLLSVVLAYRACYRCGNNHVNKTRRALHLLVLFAFYQVYDGSSSNGMVSFGDPHELVTNVTEGLYYSKRNPLIEKIIDLWPREHRIYSKESGATPWMPTGDSRTGLPFLLKQNTTRPPFQRLWLETHDHEYLALDIALPGDGHDASGSRPLYVVLHGLSGGSQEDYVREFTLRRIHEGATVVILIARGLMDTPLRGWDIFNGIRIDDVHVAATKLRSVLAPRQILAGVGFSVGGMILPNYVARTGGDCALDAAVAISGGLDMRFGYNYHRVHRMWHPFLIAEMRDALMVNKWGERARARVPPEYLKQTMRATSILRYDEMFTMKYYGFDTPLNYYKEMSAMGDIPIEDYETRATLPEHARIHDVSIPLLVVSALDDPLCSWRVVASNEGFMHPSELPSQTRSGNLVLLLTKAGGHIGWPLGWDPKVRKWEWMNDGASTFAEAVQKALLSLSPREEGDDNNQNNNDENNNDNNYHRGEEEEAAADTAEEQTKGDDRRATGHAEL